MRLWSRQPNVRAVYVTPFQDLVDERLQDWKRRFRHLENKTFACLTGELTADLKLLEASDVLLCTPKQWDVVSRRWKQRRNVQSIGLIIADEVHMIGGEDGHIYEV